MHRILNTPLLNYWIDLMENALEGKSKLKWQILSSHETNVCKNIFIIIILIDFYLNF